MKRMVRSVFAKATPDEYNCGACPERSRRAITHHERIKDPFALSSPQGVSKGACNNLIYATATLMLLPSIYAMEAPGELAHLAHFQALCDLQEVQENISRLARKPLRTPRIAPKKKVAWRASEGTLAERDCSTLVLDIIRTCDNARALLDPYATTSSSVLADTVMKETYEEIQGHYRKALMLSIHSYHKRCSSSFTMIDNILGPFTENELLKKQNLQENYTFAHRDIVIELTKVYEHELPLRKEEMEGPTHIELFLQQEATAPPTPANSEDSAAKPPRVSILKKLWRSGKNLFKKKP